MQVRFWGTRGSIAKPGPTTVRYGGNTSCVQMVSAAGTLLVIDCGTGVQDLGQHLLREARGTPIRGNILISHTHWDHIQGIPFFAPLFVPGNEWDFHAPQGFGDSLRKTLGGQMEYDYFPITPDAFGATIRYHNVAEGVFQIGDITVRTRYLNHPALTIGYRFEVDGASIVYSCDHEPHSKCLAAGSGEIGGQDAEHAEFLRGADLVIHDAQYTAAEYPAKTGWGHSTVEYAARLCADVGVRRLALTHHDPMRTDDDVDTVVAALKRDQRPASPLEIFAAAEGMVINVAGRGATRARTVSDDVPSPPAAPAGPADVVFATQDPALAKLLEASLALSHAGVTRAGGFDEALVLGANKKSMMIVDHKLLGDNDRVTALTNLVGAGGRPMPLIVIGGQPPANFQANASVEWIEQLHSEQYLRSRIRTWLMRGNFRWLPARIPEDEAERLAALHALRLLDTAAEERFDQYTRIAAKLFDVSTSLMTLVDGDRQWFKSATGTPIRETSRDMSFCAHAILQPNVLIVPDALEDDRFADNPVVVGDERVRFYAGVPLKSSGGYRIGTLCLVDQRPREMSAEETALLESLGQMVERELVKDAETAAPLLLQAR